MKLRIIVNLRIKPEKTHGIIFRSLATNKVVMKLCLAAWRSGLEQRLMVLLLPYLVGTIIKSAWWNLPSCKLKVRSNTRTENSKLKATRKRVWIRPMHRASVAFSSQEDKNEEIDQSIKIGINNIFSYL